MSGAVELVWNKEAFREIVTRNHKRCRVSSCRPRCQCSDAVKGEGTYLRNGVSMWLLLLDWLVHARCAPTQHRHIGRLGTDQSGAHTPYYCLHTEPTSRLQAVIEISVHREHRQLSSCTLPPREDTNFGAAPGFRGGDELREGSHRGRPGRAPGFRQKGDRWATSIR